MFVRQYHRVPYCTNVSCEVEQLVCSGRVGRAEPSSSAWVLGGRVEHEVRCGGLCVYRTVLSYE